MPDSFFIDTNILVSAYDANDTSKQVQAQQLLMSFISDNSAVLSAQVLSEFFTVVTTRIPEPLSVEDAEQVLDILSIMEVVEVDYRLVRGAIELHKLHSISYRDALIVAAAIRVGCTQILTEDLSAGQLFGDLLVVNPFVGPEPD